MNNVDIKKLVKVIVVCVVLFICSPFIFGVLGIIFKGVLWLILGIIIAITLAIMYFKYKIKKETKDFHSLHEKEKPQGENVESDSFIDYSDSTIVDVEEYEEVDDDEQNNKDN